MVSISGAGILMDIDKVPGPMGKSSDIDAREFPGEAVPLIQITAHALKMAVFRTIRPPGVGIWPHLQEKTIKKREKSHYSF